jgi:outer membrane protein insertion porin family
MMKNVILIAAYLLVANVLNAKETPKVETTSADTASGGIKTFSGDFSAPGTIRQIQVEGNKRVATETILAYLQVAPGASLDEVAYNQVLKALYNTGLFQDVQLQWRGQVLHVRVQENPIISRVVFEGNSKLNDEQLKSELGIKSRDVYTPAKVQTTVKRMQDMYRLTGRFGAKIEPKIIRLPENRVDLVFEINEGPVTTIARIGFIGNKVFSDSKLKTVILTRESRWYRLFSTSDNYDPDRLAVDRDMLRQFYLKNGYADFRVVSAVAELSPERDEFFITFTIDEGERYKFGTVEINNLIKKVDSPKLQQSLTIQPGEWFNEEEVEKSIRKLTEDVGNQGYAFVDVKRRLKRDRTKRLVNIVFEVVESPRVFIERIDVVGNVHTVDEVIRREMRLAEGDAYNASKERESRHKIRELGFFKNVDISHERAEDPNKTILKVQVEERGTGELMFGGGYQALEGVFANIRYNQSNLRGRGQELRSEVWLAKYNQAFDIALTEPYFLDRNLAATIGVFHTQQDRKFGGLNLYESTHDGVSLGFGYQIAGPLSQQVRYTIQQDRISNVKSDASRFVLQQLGTRSVSSVGQSLTYDKRDSRIETTSGYMISLHNDFAGVGGDIRYLRNRLQGAYYYPVADQWILSLQAQGGMVCDLGMPTRITDRFSLGGYSLRGFEFSGIGPRDKQTKDPLNGLRMYSASLQLAFPLGLPNELGIKGHLFADAGSLWKTNSPGDKGMIHDRNRVRVSVGGGPSLTLPMGAISLDFAHVLRRETYDQRRAFILRFGTIH